MSVNGNYGIYSLYNNMYQNSMLLYNNRLTKSIFPNNKAQGKDQLGYNAIGYINNLKTSSKELSGALKELSNKAFTNRTMASSNSDVMTVSYSGSNANSISPMTVRVDQTAEGQLNEGIRKDANAKYEGSNGTNQFSIETGGKTTQLNIKVETGDSNKAVQQKMADAINKAGIDVKATVETDSATNTSILKLESKKTGSDPKNGFTIKDVTGNSVAQIGANEISRAGRDAIYSVNGGAARTSESNTVNLGNGVSATFKKASAETVTVSKGKNMDYAKSQVEKMVKSYNDLFAEAAQKTNDPKAQNLASKMVKTSKTYSSSLAGVGIGFDNDGRMKIDEEKLNKAAENGKLEQFFTENSNKNYGFTNQLGRLADNVSSNTSSFVSSSLFGNDLSDNFAYTSFGNLIQYNYLSAGSIFDYLY